MTTTTYYDLNIVEGTDIVNPLIVDNPNYEKIDETMHNNAVAGVTLATEIANATVHAITRENSECAVIRFIATSEWKAGDTATVDGVPVTALLPSGDTLPDGAYVINANVLCILTGTNLTIYAERKKSENANEIAFNDTTVGAELVRLDAEIDNVNSNLSEKQNKLVLLWTNPMPTASFSAQTVNIDLSSYAGVVIDSSRNDNAYFTRTVIQKGYSGHLFSLWTLSTGFGANARLCRVEENSIVFNDAFAYQYTGSGEGNEINTAQIPLKIYGYIN